MPKPKQITADRAGRSLIARLAGNPNRVGLVDRVRQIATNLGDRPYNVDLVWTRWTGEEIGRGDETAIARLPLVPNPVIRDLTGVAMNPFSAGILPVGSLRLTEISAGQMNEDILRGYTLPNGDPRPEDVDFFYEIRSDGRGRPPTHPPERARYRLLGTPWYDADNVQFVVMVERASADPSRSGSGLPELGK